MYDGLKTNEKLRLLTHHKGLPPERHQEIWKKKQEITLKHLNTLPKNPVIKNGSTKIK